MRVLIGMSMRRAYQDFQTRRFPARHCNRRGIIGVFYSVQSLLFCIHSSKKGHHRDIL